MGEALKVYVAQDLVSFLERPDIGVALGVDVIVFQRDGHFEGRGADIIAAARAALSSEQKRKAAEAAGGE